MNPRIAAARGAIDIVRGPDERHLMVDAMGCLLDALVRENRIDLDDIVSIQFTQTADLRSANAAAALREARPEYGKVPLFCAAEPDVIDAPERMVRVLVTWNGRPPGTPVYLGNARSLRPDLVSE